MFRIDDPTAVVALPALPTDATITPGYFIGGNPTTGLPATRVRFWWLNMVQEELVGVALRAGLALAKGNNGQVLQALLVLFGGASARWQYLTVNATIVAPGWAGGIEWELCGGGGGGGASGFTYGGGGGGGAGGESRGWAAVAPGQAIPCTIGAAGLNGATPGGVGQPGGTTSLGSIASGTGGGGGEGGDGMPAPGIQGGGGMGYGGDFLIMGGSGNQGGLLVNAASGIGGSGSFGRGGASTKLTAYGDNGSGSGSGGGGSFGSSGPGGNGAAGLIRFRWTA